MATKTADEIKAEVEAGTADLASSLEEAYYGGSTVTNVDSTAGTTDNTVYVPNMTTTGANIGQIFTQTGSSSNDIYITDGTGTSHNLSGLWDTAADFALGNIKIMVTESGELMLTIDEEEYHFSKQKVKSFLEKFADVVVK